MLSLSILDLNMKRREQYQIMLNENLFTCVLLYFAVL